MRVLRKSEDGLAGGGISLGGELGGALGELLAETLAALGFLEARVVVLGLHGCKVGDSFHLWV